MALTHVFHELLSFCLLIFVFLKSKDYLVPNVCIRPESNTYVFVFM